MCAILLFLIDRTSSLVRYLPHRDVQTHTHAHLVRCSSAVASRVDTRKELVASREYICRQYRSNPTTHSHTRTGIQQEFPRDHFDLDSTPSKPAFCRTRAEGKTGYARAGTRQQTELDELHKRKRRLGTKRECLCETGAFYICGLKRRNSVQAHR